jgi:hypothetical protein
LLDSVCMACASALAKLVPGTNMNNKASDARKPLIGWGQYMFIWYDSGLLGVRPEAIACTVWLKSMMLP